MAKLSQKTISAIENGAEGTEIGTISRVLGELGLKMDIIGPKVRKSISEVSNGAIYGNKVRVK
jgi:DNA-binding XRE family transcriptional regulator